MIVVGLSDVSSGKVDPNNPIYSTDTIENQYRSFAFDNLENFVDSVDSALSLSYILLVGSPDSGHMPLDPVLHTYSGIGNTDDTVTYNYMSKSYIFIGTSSSNPEIDVPLGWWSIRNATELENIVTKTIDYETHKRDDYPNAGATIGLNPGDNNFFPSLSNYCNLMNSAGMSATDLFPMSKDELAPNVDSLFSLWSNNALDFIAYYSHGGHKGWVSTVVLEFSVSQDTLDLKAQNSDVFPVIYSGSCSSGSFEEGNPSFGEHVVAMSHGAAAFIGNAHDVAIPKIQDFGDHFMQYYTNASDTTTFGMIVEKARADVNYSMFEYYDIGIYGDPALLVKGSRNSATPITPAENNKVSLSNPRIMGNAIVFSTQSPKEISIYSINGQKLQSFVTKNKRVEIGKSLVNGIYIVNIDANDMHISKRFVINK